MLSLGLGIGTQNLQGDWLEVMYPAPLLSPSDATVTAITKALNVKVTRTTNISFHPEQCAAIASALTALTHDASLKIEVQPLLDLIEALMDAQRPLVATFIVNDDAPKSVPEVYLKLQLISHRLSRPHSLNLDGMFGVLKNIAWTNEGPIDIEELPARQLKARLAGHALSVDCVDKFPKMTDYVVPTGVRIADTSRVRLGAYLGEGTTVMHEGFCNFNAGTEGPCMIEGRISAGVFIGAHSDLGGGSSTMGTLSGGGKQVISVGEKCLIGANAGIGIPLGDRCVVESGLYITAGAKVAVLDSNGEVAQIVAARELAGQDDLLFLRHSQTGRLECRTNKTAVALNNVLHAHN